MKRTMSLVLTLGLVVGLNVTVPSQAEAAPKKFKNCTELNKTYKGGVAKSATTKNKGGATRYKPYANAALYTANSKMDRDKDGIACEK